MRSDDMSDYIRQVEDRGRMIEELTMEDRINKLRFAAHEFHRFQRLLNNMHDTNARLTFEAKVAEELSIVLLTLNEQMAAAEYMRHITTSNSR